MSKTTDNIIKPNQVWRDKHNHNVVNILMKAYGYIDGFENTVPNVVFSDLMTGDIFVQSEYEFRKEFEKQDWYMPTPFNNDGGAPAQASSGPTEQEMADAQRFTIEVPLNTKPGATFDLNPLQAAY